MTTHLCFVDTERRKVTNPKCTNAANHVPSPVDYGGFFEWCREMARTHVSRRCPDCDLYVLWVEKVPCGVCGRRYAPIGDGTPRSHRTRDGRDRCTGSHRPGGVS